MVLAQKQNYTPIEQERNPEINSCNYGYLIFDKEARIYNRAKTVCSISSAGKTG